MVMIVLQWLATGYLLGKFIRPVFTPPGSGEGPEDRTELYSNAVLTGGTVNGLHVLLHWLFLLPDDDRMLYSMTDISITFPWQAAFWYFTPHFVSPARFCHSFLLEHI